MSRQRILVLGAGGFIGRRILAALTATDWAAPVAAGRSIGKVPTGPDIEVLRLDATDEGAMARAVGACAAVVSCVTGEPAQILRSGQVLRQAAAGAAARPRIVYLSSMAAYGSATGDVDESAPLRGDLGGYSQAKAAVDNTFAGEPDVVRLRPGIVYGPESPWWSDRIARLLVQRRLGNLGPHGLGICNLVHVDDVAAAVIGAIRIAEAGGHAFNLANPDVPTWNEYFLSYARALGAGPARDISPARLQLELRVYGPALKIAEKLLGNADPWRHYEAIRPWLLQLCAHRIRLTSVKAEQVLGLRFTALTPGLEQAAGWFLNGGRT